jgi:hypothetical protein
LTWPGSCIVHDIKGENWTLTSGFRSRHGRVFLFDPTKAKSAAYNPLLEVRRSEWEVRDVQNIADVLVDPERSLERRNHWEKTSHALLVGAILHVLYAEPDKTLAGVAVFLSDPARPIEVTLRAMMITPHLKDAGPHPVIASAARELLNKSENERSGVLSTAMSYLGLYRDPVVAKVTHHCDWRDGVGDLHQLAGGGFRIGKGAGLFKLHVVAGQRSSATDELSLTYWLLKLERPRLRRVAWARAETAIDQRPHDPRQHIEARQSLFTQPVRSGGLGRVGQGPNHWDRGVLPRPLWPALA